MYKVHQHTLAFTGTIFSAFALTGSLTGSYWLPLPPPQEPTPIGADSTHHAPLLKIVSGSCRCPATLALPLRSCRAAQHLAKVGGTWVGNLFGAHSLSPARQLSCYSTSPFSYSSILFHPSSSLSRDKSNTNYIFPWVPSVESFEILLNLT